MTMSTQATPVKAASPAKPAAERRLAQSEGMPSSIVGFMASFYEWTRRHRLAALGADVACADRVCARRALAASRADAAAREAEPRERQPEDRRVEQAVCDHLRPADEYRNPYLAVWWLVAMGRLRPKRNPTMRAHRHCQHAMVIERLPRPPLSHCYSRVIRLHIREFSPRGYRSHTTIHNSCSKADGLMYVIRNLETPTDQAIIRWHRCDRMSVHINPLLPCSHAHAPTDVMVLVEPHIRP